MMPHPLAHELRGKGLKDNADSDTAVALENTETGVEKFSDREIRWPLEAGPRPPWLRDARERERPELLAMEIEPERYHWLSTQPR